MIEGHTTYVKSLTYGDEDKDGVIDHSVIEIYSQQGKNGGAHDEDALGTIKVFGDLVQMSDIETTAAPAYGIVNDISRLGEALKPISAGTAAAPVAAPSSLVGSSSFAQLDGNAPVFGAAGAFAFMPQHDAPLVFDHDSAMALNAGTIAFSFNATNLRDSSFLFSKDAKGNANGGHVSAYVTENGDLKVRLQDASKSEWIVAQGAIQERTDYDFVFSFGPAGAQLFLNGTRVAALTDVKTDLTGNAEKLVVGASNWSSPTGTAERLWGDFDGTISNFAIYGSQVSGTTAPDLSSPGIDLTVPAAVADGAFWVDGTGALMLTVGGNDQPVGQDVGKVIFTDGSILVSEIRKATAQDDILHGTSDADVLVGLAGADALNGLGGNDVLLGGNGNDTLLGGDGDDNLQGDNEEDFLSGGAGADTAVGGLGDDTVMGDAGADVLLGGVGLDYMNGGADNDMLSGEADSDTLDGWDGNDTVYGGQGWDMLIGGDGDDSLIGDTENDTLLGGNGNDTLEGGHDDDVLFGEHDDDELWGWLGNDILEGGKGDDTLFGEEGADIVSGGEGNDSLVGGSENDTLWGFTGDDTLDGGAGDDQLRAEAGNDVYLYFDGFGNDTIYGFEATNDLEDIDLSGVSTVTDYADLSANHMTQDGSDVLIDTGVGTIRLESTNLADLNAADFIL